MPLDDVANAKTLDPRLVLMAVAKSPRLEAAEAELEQVAQEIAAVWTQAREVAGRYDGVDAATGRQLTELHRARVALQEKHDALRRSSAAERDAHRAKVLRACAPIARQAAETLVQCVGEIRLAVAALTEIDQQVTRPGEIGILAPLGALGMTVPAIEALAVRLLAGDKP